MKFSLEQLQAFVEAAQSGSFSAAARRLGKAQSAVSTAISNLEIDLGVSLFQRDGRYPVLTPAGQMLKVEAEAILARCLILTGRANSLTDVVEAHLTIAMDDAIPYSAVANTLRAFEQAFPYLELEILHPTFGDIADVVQDGRAVLGLMFAQDRYPDTFSFRRIGSLTMTDVVHKTHPLAQRETVDFADLGDHRQLVFAPYGKELPSGAYLRSPRRWLAESYLALLEMAKEGFGWTIVPEWLAAADIESGELVRLALVSYPHTEWHIGIDLVWSQTQPSGQAAVWLRDRLSHEFITDH